MTDDELDDLVGEWHDAADTPGHPAHGTRLHTWLGMSEPEYSLWVTDPGEWRRTSEEGQWT